MKHKIKFMRNRSNDHCVDLCDTIYLGQRIRTHVSFFKMLAGSLFLKQLMAFLSREKEKKNCLRQTLVRRGIVTLRPVDAGQPVTIYPSRKSYSSFRRQENFWFWAPLNEIILYWCFTKRPYILRIFQRYPCILCSF